MIFSYFPLLNRVFKKASLSIIIQSLSVGGPIEFKVSGRGKEFLNLARSYLYLKVKVSKADGSNLDGANKVGVVNYPIASLFNQVDVILGGKLISSATNTYAHRSLKFKVSGRGKEFLDLARSYLYLKVKVSKADGSNLDGANKVGVVNHPIASLFNQVDVIFGGKLISSATNTYAHRSILDMLLNYDKEAAESESGCGLFCKDTAGQMEEMDITADPVLNTCLGTRSEWTKTSRTVELQGRIHSNLFNQEISSATNTYAHPSILEVLLNYDKEMVESQLGCGLVCKRYGWTNETNGHYCRPCLEYMPGNKE